MKTTETNETGPASGAKKAAKRIVDDIVERGWWTPDTPGDMEATVAVIARQIEADIRSTEPPPAEAPDFVTAEHALNWLESVRPGWGKRVREHYAVPQTEPGKTIRALLEADGIIPTRITDTGESTAFEFKTTPKPSCIDVYPNGEVILIDGTCDQSCELKAENIHAILTFAHCFMSDMQTATIQKGQEPGETPRTEDARAEFERARWMTGAKVPDGWDFSRALERENAALSAEVERLRGMLHEVADELDASGCENEARKMRKQIDTPTDPER